jgi:ABC-type Mn2+/Zn2+ transport system ATPase subunit
MTSQNDFSKDATTTEAINEALIDYSSLFRLATELRTGVFGDEAAQIVHQLRGRVTSVASPVILDNASAGVSVALDLVVASSAYSIDAATVLGLLRAGGILLQLGQDCAVQTQFGTSLQCVYSQRRNGRGSDAFALYQKMSFPESQETAFGVTLSRPLYGSVLGAGTFAFPLRKWSLLLGRSGVGKTTLLELIAGLRTSEVAQPIRPLSRLFYLPQDAEAIQGASVETNIALFAESQEIVDDITTRLHLQTIRKRQVDNTLSGGERQRVVVGQALASAADILLLDEPSAGLDQVRRTQMFHYLHANTQSRECTLLCVAHDFSPITQYFDHTFEIINGALIQHN